MSDNAERALALASLGLHVFPCFESGEHFKAPRTEHGFLEATLDPAQIAAWWSATPEAEIGVACGASGLVVVDVDNKPDKDGFASLRSAGLMPDQSTWWYETPSGGFHFVMLAPPQVPGPTQNHKLADGSRLMGVDRRSGGSYFIWWDEAWPDERSAFYPAPDWFLNHTSTEGDGWGGTLGEWLATVGGGTMSGLMRSALAKIPTEDFGRGELWARMIHLIRLATVDGEPGGAAALEHLREAWLRGPWNQPKFQTGWIVSLGNAVQSSGGVRPTAEAAVAERAPDTDYSWFSQSPTLRHIMQWSQAQWANPWAGLLVVLTRFSADLPPNVQLPRLGSLPRASLNQFSALVGASGKGKSAYITGVDESLWPRPIGSTEVAKTFVPSTGQGLIGYYTERRKDTTTGTWVDMQVETQGLAIIDEIDSLEALAKQDGSTLLSTLKTLWTGGGTGNQNATQDRRRNLSAHSYRLALLAGVQPGLGEVLFNKQAALGGLPQRFVFANTVDATLSRERGHVPDPGKLERVVHPSLPFPQILRAGGHETRDGELLVLPIQADVVAELMDNQIAIRLEESGALNGHWMLAKLKIAALLSILHGEAGVSRHWFDQAQVVMAHSDRTRDMLIDTIKRAASAENIAKAKGDAERIMASELTIVHRTADRIVDVLRVSANLSLGEITPRLSPSMRASAEAAIAMLADQGRVVGTATGKVRKSREVYRWAVI